MTSDDTVVPLCQPDKVGDPLTAALRSGPRRLLAQAIAADAEAFLAGMRGERLADGRERVVRHGHGPERLVRTGTGPGAFAARNAEVAVRRVKLRDRAAGEAGAGRIRFASAILPRWARRTQSLAALLPVLYLRGASMSGEPLGSTGDVQEALGALLDKAAPNLSPSVVARRRTEWQADGKHWQRRDLGVSRSESAWVGPALRGCLGGRHPPAGAHGAESRVPDDELPKAVQGVTSRNGVEATDTPAQDAA